MTKQTIQPTCTEEPLMVTIRCITYNHEPYIRQCLEGFVMQRTNFRFEAVVHDDASTDDTADIVREYAEKDPDIIKPIYETENQYSKRDGSLDRIMDAHMHGKYIAMCEGDDYWTDPLKLQKQVDLLEAHPECSMCCSGYVRNQAGKKDIVRSISSSKGYFFFTSDDWSKHWMANPLTWVYRRDCLDEYNLKKNSYRYSRDVHLIYHILKAGKGIYLSEPTAIYHLHPGGVCSSLSSKAKAVDSYNCYKELYLLNGDENLRLSYYNSIKSRILYEHPDAALWKEGWGIATSFTEKMKLLAAYLLPSSLYLKIYALYRFKR